MVPKALSEVNVTENRDSEPIAPYLNDFEELLTAIGVPFRERMSPGHSAQEIVAAYAEVGIDTPPDLVDWWTWTNGFRDGEDRFGPLPWVAGEPISLEESLKDHRRQLLGTELWEWNPQWTLLTYGSTGIAMDCSPVCREAPRIRYIYEVVGTNEPDEPDARGARGLRELIGWWTRAIELGQYVFDRETGYLEASFERGSRPTDGSQPWVGTLLA